ncbi:hypothetical protein ACI093_004135 [Cronobacter turicensis]
MIDIEKAVAKLNKSAEIVARKYKYGNGQCAKYVKAALISGGHRLLVLILMPLKITEHGWSQ